ncbi:MAG: PQQ-binding-like beta-propeller repeat protein [Planctomycetaceae bacterium]
MLWTQEIPAFRGMNILTPAAYEDSVFTSSYGGKSFLYKVNRGADERFQTQLGWDNKVQGYMSSPVVIDGHVYLHLRNQRFACIDLATGESRWTTTPYGRYWSLIARGDRILALDETGISA